MSDLFGGIDPYPAEITVSLKPSPVKGLWSISMTVAETTSRRKHSKAVHQVPSELLADVLDATAWWVHLASLATQGEHRGIPAKWHRRTEGRVVGWARRER